MPKLIDMKKVLLLLPMLAFAFNTFGQDSSKLQWGDPVPEFSVRMLDGSVIDIADLKGKVVVINFWATWCPPCRAELSRVDSEIIERFAGEDLVFIAIARGESRDKVEDFRKVTNYKFQMGLDTDSDIFNKFADKSIPRNYIIDRDGKIAATYVGYDNELFQKLISDIDKTLKGESTTQEQ